jgi:acyl dehydratase
VSQAKCLEDYVVGQTFSSSEAIEVTADDIISFARQFDPQPGHISQEEAERTPFHGLSASGWHTAALTMKLLVELGFSGVIGAAVSLTWPTPTRPGDQLRLHLRVVGVRESATKPDRGVVNLEYDTVNQSGEIRQHTQTTVIAWHRAALEAVSR